MLFFAPVKVLILHQHFKTPQGGGAIRSYYLASALVDAGIRTVVVTAHNGRNYRVEHVDGIEVHYLPIAYDNSFGFYRRIYSFFRFVIKSTGLASQHRDADVVYCISTPLTTGVAARMIKRRFGIPFIFEVGDLWPDAPAQMGFVKNPLVKAALYRMESGIYKSASSIVALSHPIRDAILKKAPHKTVHVVPNMADTEFFHREEKREESEDKFGVRGKFVVSYIGALGVANGLHYFIECAAASQREGLPIHFILCGEGAMKEHLKSHAEKLGLQNLTIVPFQNRSGVREVLSVTDANFICYLPVKVLETGSPNKYFDGLASAKLTIVNFGGWIREEIEKEKCGLYVDPANADDFFRKLTPFVEDEALLQAYQNAARTLAERKYSRRELSKQFRELFAPEVRSGASSAVN